MASNIYEQLSEQLAASAASHHADDITYSKTVLRYQVEGLLTTPSNSYELLQGINNASAATRGAQPPIMPPVSPA